MLSLKRGAILQPVPDDVPRLSEVYNTRLKMPLGISNWRKAVSLWNILGNDLYGDCVWAAFGHIFQTWTANARVQIRPDTPAILADYEQATGFRLGPPAYGDNGTVILTALKYIMSQGMLLKSNGINRRLGAFAFINPADLTDLMSSIDAFGGFIAGVQLPASAESDFEFGRPWADTSGVPTEGHCVYVVDYDVSQQIFYVITWGKVQIMTFQYWLKYGMESYALFAREWLKFDGSTPSNLTSIMMENAVRSLGGTFGPDF